MGRRYSLTPAARADLVDTDDYIRQDSPEAAERVRARLRQAMYTGMGHLREDLADEPLRFWPLYSYLIIYRAAARPIEILRIIHGSRDVRKLLAGP
jgi:plasmid stabilization system protein ParE